MGRRKSIKQPGGRFLGVKIQAGALGAVGPTCLPTPLRVAAPSVRRLAINSSTLLVELCQWSSLAQLAVELPAPPGFRPASAEGAGNTLRLAAVTNDAVLEKQRILGLEHKSRHTILPVLGVETVQAHWATRPSPAGGGRQALTSPRPAGSSRRVCLQGDSPVGRPSHTAIRRGGGRPCRYLWWYTNPGNRWDEAACAEWRPGCR